MLTISMCLQWIWSDFGKKTTRRLSLLVMLFILTLFFASVDNRCKLFIGPKALRWSLFYVLSCYGQISGSSGLAFYRLAGSNSRLLKSTDSKTVSTTECLYLLYHYHLISKGYRPETRGYVIYSPRALPEGNKSHNHELKADKRLIFTLARIPQGMQKYIDEKCLYCSSFFCFLTLHAGTGGIHRFLGFLIMLVFQSRISN